MAVPHHTPKRRADAERSIARILDAAVDALAEDQEASMSAIAERAGVVRATIYVHFPTREALIAAVTDRALAEVAAVIAETDPEQGDPAEALRRIVAATWRMLGRYHALVAITTSTSTPEQVRRRHEPVLGRLLPLVERGQAAGVFRTDVPAGWHLAMLMAVIHAASAEVRAGRVEEAAAETAVVDSVLGVLAGAPPRALSR